MSTRFNLSQHSFTSMCIVLLATLNSSTRIAKSVPLEEELEMRSRLHRLKGDRVLSVIFTVVRFSTWTSPDLFSHSSTNTLLRIIIHTKQNNHKLSIFLFFFLITLHKTCICVIQCSSNLIGQGITEIMGQYCHLKDIMANVLVAIAFLTNSK